MMDVVDVWETVDCWKYAFHFLTSDLNWAMGWGGAGEGLSILHTTFDELRHG